MSSFFAQEAPELESFLGGYLESLAENIPEKIANKIEAIILGGGYGRGEGGIFKTETSAEKLYNDLDIFLFTPNPTDSSLIEWIHSTEKKGTELLGIDVEIKALPQSDLKKNTTSMLFFDLVHGHHIIYGPQNYLLPYKEYYKQEYIHLEEATRLLWNRGSGLYFAREHILKNKDKGFVQRNHQKVKLALGDALVCANKNYTPLCKDRHEYLKNYTYPNSFPFNQIIELHKEAVQFKHHPVHLDLSWEKLTQENQYLYTLWEETFRLIESKRLCTNFNDTQAYLNYPQRLTQQVPPLKCMLINLREFLKNKIYFKPITDYPRNVLFKVLLCLFNPTFKKEIPKLIKTNNCENLSYLYEQLWKRFG